MIFTEEKKQNKTNLYALHMKVKFNENIIDTTEESNIDLTEESFIEKNHSIPLTTLKCVVSTTLKRYSNYKKTSLLVP